MNELIKNTEEKMIKTLGVLEREYNLFVPAVQTLQFLTEFLLTITAVLHLFSRWLQFLFPNPAFL